jgi:hypothetical protein
MTVDFNTDCYDPVYAVLGVTATMTAGAIVAEVTVLDKTRRKTVTSGVAEVSSVGPGVRARMVELAANGITSDNWDGALLTFNGRNWIVRKGDVLGSPNGEDLGQVWFLLKEAAVG